MGIKYYLSILIKDGHLWQRKGLNGYEKKFCLFFSPIQLVILVLSLLCSILMYDGFDKDFVSYTVTSLSIFVGLFFSIIISVFDKFSENTPDSKTHTERERIISIQRKLFAKQFTALISYAILLSLICIVFLSISFFTKYFNYDVKEYYNLIIIENIRNTEIIKLLFRLLMTIIYRSIVIYFLLDFLLIVTYGLSSIYSFIKLEYDK